ncbi:MAG: flavin reductase family protein [Candidatus Heimdallarchaeaceae archaeon]|jgi:flavin reductase (DIM6/NTAB) family NADH-FMN oxidoreductase RutF
MKKSQEVVSSALYPNPVMLISASYEGKESIITLAWGGTCSSSPPHVAVAIRKGRYSHDLIVNSKEFVVNIPTADMVDEVEFCGTKSGRDFDKWTECNFTKGKSDVVNTPHINECPVSLECNLKQIIELGSHDLFIGEVVALHIDEEWKDERYPKMLTYTRGIYKKCISID